jgi:heat shock protein HtpX
LSKLAVLQEQIAANRRAYQACVALVVAGLALLGLLLALPFGGWLVGLLVGLVAGALLVWLAPRAGERAALRGTAAEPADPGRWARYHNLVEGLCQAAGLPMPRLYVVDSDAANAFSVGHDPERAALVVTGGLFAGLNRVELEGVLAHELNHIWSWGARLATLGVALGRLPWLRRLTTPPRRELDADEGGARLTRYPPGLVSALRKLAADQPPGPPNLRHLWIVAPDDDTRPPLPERIAALQEL